MAFQLLAKKQKMTDPEIFEKYATPDQIRKRAIIERLAKIRNKPPSIVEKELIDIGLLKWNWSI